MASLFKNLKTIVPCLLAITVDSLGLGGVLSERIIEPWFDFATPLWTAAALAAISFLWILLGFRDTAQASGEPIDWLRPIRIFTQAFATPSVRSLAIVHLLFQLGFSIYYAMISVLLIRQWHYASAEVGLFTGVVGLGFVVALVVVMPLATRRLGDKTLALLGLLINGAGVALSGMPVGEGALWAGADADRRRRPGSRSRCGVDGGTDA